MCSADNVTAVVTSREFVHINPTALGSRFIFMRSLRRSANAGASSRSMVMMTLTTDLVESDISNSFHPNFTEHQNNILCRVVLGDGMNRVEDEFPMFDFRLDGD